MTILWIEHNNNSRLFCVDYTGDVEKLTFLTIWSVYFDIGQSEAFQNGVDFAVGVQDNFFFCPHYGYFKITVQT